MLEYKKYIEDLNIEFTALINSSDSFNTLKNNFVLCDEQFINKNAKKITPNNVFGVINFGSTTLDYGQTEVPFSISFIGQANVLDTLQLFLNTFVEQYNLKLLPQSKVLQSYATPIIDSNFSILDAGLRNIFTLEGVLVIIPDIIDITSVEYKVDDNTYEELPFLKVVSNIQNQTLPEAFSGTSGRTISTLQFQTQTLTITMYPLVCKFLSKLMKSQIEKDGDFTEKYTIKLTYNNGIESEFDYVLTSIYHEKAKAGIPSLSLVFTR